MLHYLMWIGQCEEQTETMELDGISTSAVQQSERLQRQCAHNAVTPQASEFSSMCRPGGVTGAVLSTNEAVTHEGLQRQFQTLMVSLMLKEAMKEDLMPMFGDGVAGETYLSVFSDTLASKIIDAGILGTGFESGMTSNVRK